MGCARCARDKYHQYHKAPVKTHHFSSQFPKGRCETCYLSFEKGNHFPKFTEPSIHHFDYKWPKGNCDICKMSFKDGNHFRLAPETPKNMVISDASMGNLSSNSLCCGYPPKVDMSYDPADETPLKTEAHMPDRSQLQKDITEAISGVSKGTTTMPNNSQESNEPSVDKVTLDTDAIAKIIGEEMAKLKAKAEATSDEVRERDEMEAVISAREYEGYPPEEKEMPDDITMEEGIMDHYPATRKNLALQQELGHTSTVIVPEGKMSDTTFILNGREFKVTNWNSQQGMHHPTRVTIELQALI